MNKSIGVSWLRRDEIDWRYNVVYKSKQSWLSPDGKSQAVVSVKPEAQPKAWSCLEQEQTQWEISKMLLERSRLLHKK